MWSVLIWKIDIFDLFWGFVKHWLIRVNTDWPGYRPGDQSDLPGQRHGVLAREDLDVRERGHPADRVRLGQLLRRARRLDQHPGQRRPVRGQHPETGRPQGGQTTH